MSKRECSRLHLQLKSFFTPLVVVASSLVFASCGGGSGSTADPTAKANSSDSTVTEGTANALAVSGRTGAVPDGWTGRVPTGKTIRPTTDGLPRHRAVTQTELFHGTKIARREIIVSINYGADVKSFMARLKEKGWVVVSSSPPLYQVDVSSSSASYEAILAEADAIPEVFISNVNRISSPQSLSSPNDPLVTNPDFSWHFQRPRIKEAWDIISREPRLSEVVIGVADGGFRFGHEDLKISTICSAIDCASSSSGSEGGLCIASKAETALKDSLICHSANHGMMVAGIISSNGDDSKGTAGVAFQIPRKLNVYRLTDAPGAALEDTLSVIDGVRTLLQAGVNIINLSWAYDTCDVDAAGNTVCTRETNESRARHVKQFLHAIYLEAKANPSAVFVQAAGNEGRNRFSGGGIVEVAHTGYFATIATGRFRESLSASLSIFAQEIAKRTIVVGAYGKDGQNTLYTNLPTAGDNDYAYIFAPGGEGDAYYIPLELSKSKNNIPGPSYRSLSGYVAMGGTSQAAPHVSGVVAMMISLMSSTSAKELDAASIVKLLKSSARRELGFYYLDAEAAVKAALVAKAEAVAEANCGTISAPTTKPIALSTVTAGTPYTYTVATNSAPKNGKTFSSYLWTSSEGFTNTAFVSPDIAIILSNPTSPPSVATVSVTPVLNDGTVCKGSIATSQVTVQGGPINQTSYNLEAAFTTNSTLNAPWSFGWQVSSGAVPIPYASFQQSGSRSDYPTLAIWNKISGSAGSPPVEVYPWVVKNTGASPVLYSPLAASFPAQSIIVVPGSTGERVVFRWTAPAAGAYEINASYELMQGGAVDVHVQRNGIDIFSASIARQGSQATAPAQTVVLNAGDKIDFAVGDGGNTQNSDMTRVSASVKAVSANGYDLASGFSATANPNGTWSYGWMPPSYNASFNKFSSNNIAPYSTDNKDIKFWTANTPYSLWVAKNTSASAITFAGATVPAGAIAMHPGRDGEFAVSRWTAPASGRFNINTTFSLAEGSGTVDVHILKNHISIYDANLPGVVASNSNTINLMLGETLDFVVGSGGNGYTSDTTLVSVSIAAATGGTVQVNANDPIGSPFTVPSGVTSCTFSASGSWSYGYGASSGADGAAFNTTDYTRILGTAPWFSLIANTSTGYIPIGSSKTILAVPGQSLVFMINEGLRPGVNSYLDNSGSLSLAYSCN